MEIRKSSDNPLHAGDEAPKRGIHSRADVTRSPNQLPPQKGLTSSNFLNESLQTTISYLKTNINRFLKMIRWRTIPLQWGIQDFLEGGANSQSGCANLIFYNFLAENCKKMKEFGPRRGRPSLAPLWIRQRIGRLWILTHAPFTTLFGRLRIKCDTTSFQVRAFLFRTFHFSILEKLNIRKCLRFRVEKFFLSAFST